IFFFFFFSSRRRHTRSKRDWSSDVCSSDLVYHPGHQYQTGLHGCSGQVGVFIFEEICGCRVAGGVSVLPLLYLQAFPCCSHIPYCGCGVLFQKGSSFLDRKSTRLNSSHVSISYAVFCLNKKNPNLTHVSS